VHERSAERTCPSALAEPGALLVGVRGADGALAYLTPAPVVDLTLLDTARERFGDPRTALRFASPCAQARCPQWNGSGCGVIEAVIADLGEREPQRLPACAIRSTCRWFAQRGRAACAVCPEVVTNPRS
jgi:hypothetical protein